MKGVKNIFEIPINSGFQAAASIALSGSPKPFRTRAWRVVQTFHESENEQGQRVARGGWEEISLGNRKKG